MKGRKRGRTLFLVAGLTLAAIAAAGCRQRLPHAAASPHALAREVLTALETRDADRLRELAVSESEFRSIVWPELPAARPERNLTVAYVWSDLRGKSEFGLHRILAEHGGKARSLLRVDFAGETTQHRSYLVRRETIVVAHDPARGEQPLRLFGSMIERDGGFKVFSYAVD